MRQTESAITASLTGKWKPYPAYKDWGVEWLGEIPEQWGVMRLKFIAAEPLQYGANESAELNDPNLPRYIRITDISEDGSLRNDTYKSLPEEIAEPYLLKKGDLLFARSGATVGKSILYHDSWGKACYAGYLIRLRINSHISNPNFISYFVTSSAYQNWLSSVFIQATIQNVSAEKYANLLVPVPSLPEQRAIITFLDHETERINALIAKKERLIELLQEKRAALISHAVTKGLDPMVPMKDSGVEWLGEIPMHWEVKRLKFAASFYGGGTPYKENLEYWSGDIPWISPKDMKAEIINDTEDHISKVAIENSSTRLIEPGAVLLVVRSGILRHSIPVAINIQPVALNQDMKAIVAKSFLMPEYLASVIRGHQDALLVEWRKEGATVESIEFELLVNTISPIPPLCEQLAIIAYLKYETAKIDALISRIRDGIEKLKEYSTALISAAVTGKIDLGETIEEYSEHR
jgi:type I restriction enzyme, S subunit